MNFLSYGPFRYEEQNAKATVLLFEHISIADEELHHGVGVYIFAARDATGKLIPWYVGKASKHDMGARICTHLNEDKFLDLIHDSGGISIFLVAAVHRNQQLKMKTHLSEADHLEIGQLERAFIGSAYAQNRDLLNIRCKGSEQYVPVAGHVSCGMPNGNISDLAELLGFEPK